MRSCIYCGKNLEQGEKCDCPQSVRMRETKAAADNKSTGSTETAKDNVYTTGYTKKEKKKRFKWKKPKFHRYHASSSYSNGIGSYIKSAINDPVNSVANPGYMNCWQIILITLLEGVVLSACYFFVSSRLYSGMMRLMGDILGFGGINGLYNIKNLLLTVLTGTIAVTAGMFIFYLVFWCINKFILRQSTPFWIFITRLAAATLPVTLLGVVGIVISFFSIYALIMLVATGVILWLVLTYEALRAEWSYIGASKTVYMMALGMFIMFVIFFNLVRI